MKKIFSMMVMMLVLCVVGTSFGNDDKKDSVSMFVPLVDGQYHFTTDGSDNVILVAKKDSMSMYIEDVVVKFGLKQDSIGYYYISTNKKDSTDFTIIFFKDNCVGVGEVVKLFFKFALYNVKCFK